MKKNTKLKLQELNVQSFLTHVQAKSVKHSKGGAIETLNQCSIIFCSQIDACLTARGCTL